MLKPIDSLILIFCHLTKKSLLKIVLRFRSRKRKKIRVTIIEQISPSDNDDGEIPPPPPGSPPLFSIKEFLARYPSSKSALPIPIITGAN